MKILSGSLPRDSGRIFIQDEEIHDLNPERSQALGIGMVYQELSLAPNLSVAENVFLGHLPRSRLGVVDWNRVYGIGQPEPVCPGARHRSACPCPHAGSC